LVAWFNLYKNWGRRDNDFLEYCSRRKGKNVHFIDGDTGIELTEEQFDNLINESVIQNYIIMEEQEENTLYPKTVRKQKSINKHIGRPRKSIPLKLRQEIKSEASGKCRICGKENADQNHHKDGNPSNNHKSNIELLCYDCHKIADADLRKLKIRRSRKTNNIL
jgi:nitrate/TMAO reductase-like tetraheme cytochrome c subunit